MRKVRSFTMAAVIFGAGMWLFVQEVLWAQGIYIRALGVAICFIVLGGYWLLVDFIAPALGIKVQEMGRGRTQIPACG